MNSFVHACGRAIACCLQPACYLCARRLRCIIRRALLRSWSPPCTGVQHKTAGRAFRRGRPISGGRFTCPCIGCQCHTVCVCTGRSSSTWWDHVLSPCIRARIMVWFAPISYSNKLFCWLLKCSRAYLYHYFSLFCLTKRRLASAEREHCLGSRDQLASEETPAEGIIPFFSSPPQLLD